MGEYSKHTWAYGDKIQASVLNEMEDGIKYANTSLISYGSGTPSDATGENNDLYIDTDNNELLMKEAGSWTSVQDFIDRSLGDGMRFNASGELEPDLGSGLRHDAVSGRIEVDPDDLDGTGLDTESDAMLGLYDIASGTTTVSAGDTNLTSTISTNYPIYVAYFIDSISGSGSAEIGYEIISDGTDQWIRFTNSGSNDATVKWKVFSTE